MGIKSGQSSQLDKKFGFGGGFKADLYWIGVVFMVKIFFVFLQKEKIQIRVQTRFKEIQQPFLGNSTRNACWYFLTHIEIILKRMKVFVALHLEVFRVLYFP
jgi:hypothetical protein